MEKQLYNPNLNQELNERYNKLLIQAAKNPIDPDLLKKFLPGNIFDRHNNDNFANLKLKLSTKNPINLIREIRDYITLRSQLRDARIKVGTISELRFLLNVLKKDNPELSIEEVLAHENAHSNVASSEGSSTDGYVFTLYKSDDDVKNKFIYNVGANIYMPAVDGDFTNLTLEQIELAEKIIKAPETYKHEDLQMEGLSSGDMQMLDFLTNQKKNLIEQENSPNIVS